MKRIVALLLCVLLVGSLAGEVMVVQAAEPGIKITGYSVSGVPNVANIFAVTLHLRWDAGGQDNILASLSIESISSNYKQAENKDGSYVVSTSPIASKHVSGLEDGETAFETFFFLRTGRGDKLDIQFEFKYLYGQNISSGTNTGSVLVVKSSPDIEDPKSPDPPPPIIPEIPDPVPVDTTKYRPNLTVDTEAAMPFLGQETEELVIPIKNTAIYSANKITVAIESANKSEPLFTANRITVSATINTLSRDQVKEAKFDVELAPGAITGIHEVTLNYTFHNNHGDRFTDSETAYIRVENQNAAPRLAVTSSQSLTPGQRSQVRFKLTNSGTSAARNVKVTLEGLDPAGVAVVNDIDVKYVDLVEGGGSAEVAYNLLPAPTLEGSSARLQAKIEYTDTSGATYSSTNAVFLPLLGAVMEADKGVPRLIINRYSFSPQEIRAGSNFLLDLDLQNTSRSKTITNLKVTIISEEGVFLPIDASNTLFIESIAPGEVMPASLMLSAKADAENKAYPLRITFEYEDSQGTAHSSQEMITIPVHQNSRLEVSEIVFYGEPMLYNMVPVNIEFYNLGKTILYNLMVQAEGPFQLEGGRYFVGNFNPGASDSFNFAVTPTEPGEQIGEVVFQFEDSVGTQLEVRRELKLNVMEPFFPDEPGPEMPPPQQPTSKWTYIGIGAAVLIIAAGALLIWRRRRKNKKLELQRAQDFTAATQAVVPEIEYVGFEEETQPDKSEPNN